jgi:phage shock protein E
MFGFIKGLFNKKNAAAELVYKGAIIVDVRTRSEFQAGHIKGSRNIPFDTINKELVSLKKLNKPLVTVCLSGMRSGKAKSILSSAGIEAYNGGAWTTLNRQLRTP